MHISGSINLTTKKNTMFVDVLSSIFKIGLIIIVSTLLTACGGNEFDDLKSYIETVKSRKSNRIEPLPEIEPYETYTYSASNLRSPFISTIGNQEQETASTDENGIRPDPNRRKEALESFPLDTLRMVGILELSENLWAIIIDSDGVVHRVQTGNYIGQNHGRIIHISEDEVELVEIVPNGLGGWQERPTSIALSEESEG